MGALPSDTVIPSKTSELVNDSEFATESYVDTIANEKMPIVTFGEEAVLVEDTEVTFTKDGDNNWYISDENPLVDFDSESLTENKLYKVEWDGVEYELLFSALYEKTSNLRMYQGGFIGNI